MKRLSLVTAIIASVTAAVALLSGCGVLVITKDAGPVMTREFEFADFNAVEIGSAFRLDISRSDSYSVEIVTNENLFKDIKVEKTGRTLRIGVDWRSALSFGNRPLEARIKMPELVGLKMSGATKGTVRGFNSASDLDVFISGASSLDVDMDTGKFTGRISGSSELNARINSSAADLGLSGASSIKLDMETGEFIYESSGASDGAGVLKAVHTRIHLTGSSDMRLTGSGGDLRLSGSGASKALLRGFDVEDADIELSGATDADLDINGTLTMTLSGASDLTCGGNPTLGDRMDITGGSRFERR